MRVIYSARAAKGSFKDIYGTAQSGDKKIQPQNGELCGGQKNKEQDKMIGIIGAMASEVNGLKASVENAKTKETASVSFCSGTLCGKDVVIAEAGVGKVNAAVTALIMIREFGADAVINIGVAGGLEGTLKVGDIVVADKVVEHDMDTTPLGDAPGFITGLDTVYMECDKHISEALAKSAEELGAHTVIGTIASGDQFICRDDQREKLISVFGAAAAEMEGAAIGHVCVMNGVPFGVLRAMSDCANDESAVSFPEFEKKAAALSIEIVKKAIVKL